MDEWAYTTPGKSHLILLEITRYAAFKINIRKLMSSLYSTPTFMEKYQSK